MISKRSVHAEVVFAGVSPPCSRVVPGWWARRPREVAQELGVSEATVYRWIAQDEVDLGERSGVRSGERAELSQARARIRELESELELTRKASEIFEEQQAVRRIAQNGADALQHASRERFDCSHEASMRQDVDAMQPYLQASAQHQCALLHRLSNAAMRRSIRCFRLRKAAAPDSSSGAGAVRP